MCRMALVVRLLSALARSSEPSTPHRYPEHRLQTTLASAVASLLHIMISSQDTMVCGLFPRPLYAESEQVVHQNLIRHWLARTSAPRHTSPDLTNETS